MKKKLCLSAFSLFIGCYAIAQSIVINPDGTHSTVINHGSTSTIINTNGTHSTVINHGSTSTVVNPNGTHSILINHGSTATLINPSGTHSTVVDSGVTLMHASSMNSNETHEKRRNKSARKVKKAEKNKSK